MSPQPVVSVFESGPVFLGCLGHWMLFGAFLVQFYDYFITYHNTDRMFIKVVVYTVFIAGVLQTVVETYTIWNLVIGGWGVAAAFQNTPILSPAVPAISAVVSSSVQNFFAWRIWNLRKTSKPTRSISILITLISFVQCGGGLAVCVEFATRGRAPQVLIQLKPAVEVWLIGSFMCDLLIAVTMLTLLVQARMQSSFKSTAKMINRLIVITIETGTVTVILVAIQLIVYLKFPTDYLHLAMMYVLVGVYSNVLLATLNGRERARQYANDVEFSINLVSDPSPQSPQSPNVIKTGIPWRRSDLQWLNAPEDAMVKRSFGERETIKIGV